MEAAEQLAYPVDAGLYTAETVARVDDATGYSVWHSKGGFIVLNWLMARDPKGDTLKDEWVERTIHVSRKRAMQAMAAIAHGGFAGTFGCEGRA